MTARLDTDVLVDYLRGAAAAKTWLQGAGSEQFQVPGVVAMELVNGCRDAAELRRLTTFLDQFTLTWPDASENIRAYQLLRTYRLTTALSIPDCLIAAMAIARGMRLYTFNLKHYSQIAGLEVRQPYPRA